MLIRFPGESPHPQSYLTFRICLKGLWFFGPQVLYLPQQSFNGKMPSVCRTGTAIAWFLKTPRSLLMEWKVALRFSSILLSVKLCRVLEIFKESF